MVIPVKKTIVVINLSHFELKQLNKKIINSVTKGLVIGSLAAVISFLVGGMFETNFYDSEVVMLLYFIMGLALAETSKKVGYKNDQL